MEALAIGLTALLAALLGAGASGFVLWRILSQKLINPQPIFEEPSKKRFIITPGEGTFVLREKRKTKWLSDEDICKLEEKAK